jgi:phosphatidylethanolamine/phosphatidyl-N-methylethanolamine N-methyltransferase
MSDAHTTPRRPVRTRTMSLAEPLIRLPIAARLEDEVRVTAADFIERLSDMRLKTAAARYKLEDEVRQGAGEVRARVRNVTAKARIKLGDEARFLKSWIDSPGKTGAVTPSGPFLARRMASYVDIAVEGPVIEIGPGTGPVTEALIEHGVAEERLVLVEFSPEFCALLRQRFPKATVIEGDAYALSKTLTGAVHEPAAAIVSSLPLFNQPPHRRSAFASEAFALMRPGSPLIQFTYAMASPLPRKQPGLSAKVSDWVLRNIPPARVWVYRRG